MLRRLLRCWRKKKKCGEKANLPLGYLLSRRCSVLQPVDPVCVSARACVTTHIALVKDTTCLSHRSYTLPDVTVFRLLDARARMEKARTEVIFQVLDLRVFVVYRHVGHKTPFSHS